MIEKYPREGLLKGLGCKDETNAIINLHYMDDTLIFGKEELPQAMVLKWILFCYEKWSGLKINYHKSSLIFLGEIMLNSLFNSLVFYCPVQRLPISYLRIPLSLGRPNKLQWRPLIERM